MGDIYALLSERAHDCFGDVNIVRDRTRVSPGSFLMSAFRRREDLGRLLATSEPPDSHSSAPTCLFAFVLSALFPAVNSFTSAICLE
jgi:hypothetical protein